MVEQVIEAELFSVSSRVSFSVQPDGGNGISFSSVQSLADLLIHYKRIHPVISVGFQECREN